MYRFLLVLLVTLMAPLSSLRAQTIGVVHKQDILTKIPDFKLIENQIKFFQDSLVQAWQAHVLDFQQRLQELRKKSNKGELSPVQEAKETSLLEAEQGKLLDDQNNIQRKVDQKTFTLVSPLNSRIDEVIISIAKEKGLMIVLNHDAGLAYRDVAVDITPLVKAQLGIQD